MASTGWGETVAHTAAPVLKVKKLRDDARLPAFSHEGDAAFDFFLPENDVVPPLARGYRLPLGIAVEIPVGYFLEIFIRSGTSMKTPLRLSNSVGVVDEGYRGELCLILDNIDGMAWGLKKGERIAQGMLRKRITPELVEVQELAKSERGAGGFGSTGR